MAQLYLVATPIGNLEDITLRALRTLREVDVVASEDTRKTGRLLKHYGISKPQISFHEYNEEQAIRRILGFLEAGQSVAVVSNAGTPGISDPGHSAVRLAIEQGYDVTLIPGPTAFVMAVVLSGLPSHAFTFRGFPPRRKGPRRRFLQADALSPYTLVYYESPHRLLDFLADALEVLGDRRAAVCNELTKMFERTYRGSLGELLQTLQGEDLRGEFVVVVAGAQVDSEQISNEQLGG